MKNRLGTLLIPAAIVALSCAPAFAQFRIGVDLGAVSIRIAPDAPPPPRREYRTVRPSSSYLWVDGYWDRHDDRWAWAPGRWEQPAQHGSTWVRPQYRREGDAYRYEPGRWSHQKMVEGDDYRDWKKEHGQKQGNKGNNGNHGNNGNNGNHGNNGNNGHGHEGDDHGRDR